MTTVATEILIKAHVNGHRFMEPELLLELVRTVLHLFH